MSERTALECLKYYFALPSMEHSGEAESFAKLLAVVDAARAVIAKEQVLREHHDPLVAALTALDSP